MQLARQILRHGVLLVTVFVATQARADFVVGDVVVANEVSPQASSYRGGAFIFNADGTLQGGVAGTFDGNPFSLAFDPSRRLYVATSSSPSDALRTEVYTSALGVAQHLPIGALGYAFESTGAFYVARSGQRVEKYTSAGVLLRSFSLPGRFPTALVLAPDQCTLYYIDNGGVPRLARHDVCSDVSLPDVVAELPPLNGARRSLRLLRDGSLLVNSGDAQPSVGGAVRFGADGTLLRKYVIPGLNEVWLAIALTPSGDEMWAAVSTELTRPGARLYRLNLASGEVVAGPFEVPDSKRVASIAVAGEHQAALAVTPPIPTLSLAGAVVLVSLLAIVAFRVLS